MANPRIIYVNNQQLQDHRIWSWLHDQLDYPWQEYVKITTRWNGTIDGAYLRTGQNTFPFRMVDPALPLCPVPKYQPDFRWYFSEITDTRLADLKAKFWHRPWMIQYSGGIDSTLIMCAILKHLDPADLDNITVCCNRVSVYENPEFFYRFVKPNFRLQDSSGRYDPGSLCEHNFVLDGEPSYAWPPFGVLGTLRSVPRRLEQSLDQPGDLLDILSDRIDKTFAEWLYQCMIVNIRSQDIPIKDYYQFFWWLGFNVGWANLFHSLADVKHLSQQRMRDYFKFSHHWYDFDLYQQWAMHQDFAKELYSPTQCLDKLAAKVYIQEFTGDDIYFRYKGKCTSSAHRTDIGYGSWFCILDDFTPLTLEQDLDLIKQLLPGHLNPDLRAV